MGIDASRNNILLFKSTSRWDYRQRILTALSLPERVLWKTHYSRKYCSKEISAIVFGNLEKKGEELVGKKGTLIFADTVSDPAKFFPLREFEIVSSRRDGENWVVGLRFGKYLAYSKDDLIKFQDFLKGSTVPLPPADQSFAQFFPPIEASFKKCPPGGCNDGLSIGGDKNC